MEEYPHRLSVAPMMQVTDRHWRFMARGLSAETLLYTEMMVDTAVVHNPSKFVGLEACEGPIAVQMGGNDPEMLAQATQLVTQHMPCVEVNLNCGCPSHVVAGKQCFGARLMADPVRVGACVAAMQRVSSVPVTVKHRLGTDLSGADYDATSRFVKTVAEFGVRHFALHARMAILGVRISTEKNRSVPPLKPEVAHMLARDLPELTFSLNGGLKTLADCVTHLMPGDDDLPPVHSAMVGRAAWHAPCDLLASADIDVYGKATSPASHRRALLERYADYLDDFYVRSMTDDDISVVFRPLHYVFAGSRGAKRFRTLLVENAPNLLRRHKEDVAPSDIIWDAINDVATLPLDDPLVKCPL